jgi:predicted small metal-binding protein
LPFAEQNRLTNVDHAVITREDTIMKHFECGTLVPGCEWHTRADEEAEVVRRAVDHLRVTHGEEVIRPSMVDHIKERIHDDQTTTA